jgi:protein-S-isoprenylcysteine O-methyltransferase Ste14
MPQIIPVFLAMLLFTCLTSFVWGMRCCFVKPDRLAFGTRLTALAALASSLLHFQVILSMREFSITRFSIAAAAYLSAAMLYWWAVRANRAKPLAACFSGVIPVHLNTGGPYQLVRHPFYCSYLLACLNGVIATKSSILVPTAIVMFFIYRAAALREEEAFSSSPLALRVSALQQPDRQILAEGLDSNEFAFARGFVGTWVRTLLP